MPEPAVQVLDRLDPDQQREVRDLVAVATDVDRVSPVSEAVLLHLGHGGAGRTRDLLAVDPDGAVLGYAYLDLSDPDGGPAAELVVHPRGRRRGVGSALLDGVEAASPDGRPRLWAHGRHPGAIALAASRGYAAQRILYQLRRSLLVPLPELVLPAGLRLRPFVVGADEAAWLAVNSRAFANHPEQGRWTLDDLRIREAEPWFDPAGFLLAVRAADGSLAGFHWTKIHRDHPSQALDTRPAGTPESVGEVYVLGVDPSAQGLGLGPALTVAGLRYLAGQGLPAVILYVDESNAGAVRLYTRLGFTESNVDVQYQRSRA